MGTMAPHTSSAADLLTAGYRRAAIRAPASVWLRSRSADRFGLRRVHRPALNRSACAHGEILRARLPAMALIAAMLLFLPPGAPLAEEAQHPVQHDTVSQHHRVEYLLMKDMADDMARMADEMATKDATVEQRKQMARRMERMSVLMHHMSGFWARPAMSEPEMKKQMDQMRREMDAMIGERTVQSGTK